MATMGRMDVIPRAEAVHAANWWASRLGNAEPHVTDSRDDAERETQAVAVFASSFSRTFTDQQRTAFARELAPLIEAHLRENETGIWEGAWRRDDPKRGSAIRDVSIDYAAHPVLRQAAEAAGIELKTLDLPLKTVMWINPGEVIVAEGYGSDGVDVWRGEASPVSTVPEHPGSSPDLPA